MISNGSKRDSFDTSILNVTSLSENTQYLDCFKGIPLGRMKTTSSDQSIVLLWARPSPTFCGNVCLVLSDIYNPGVKEETIGAERSGSVGLALEWGSMYCYM